MSNESVLEIKDNLFLNSQKIKAIFKAINDCGFRYDISCNGFLRSNVNTVFSLKEMITTVKNYFEDDREYPVTDDKGNPQFDKDNNPLTMKHNPTEESITRVVEDRLKHMTPTYKLNLFEDIRFNPNYAEYANQALDIIARCISTPTPNPEIHTSYESSLAYNKMMIRTLIQQAKYSFRVDACLAKMTQQVASKRVCVFLKGLSGTGKSEFWSWLFNIPAFQGKISFQYIESMLKDGFNTAVSHSVVTIFDELPSTIKDDLLTKLKELITKPLITDRAFQTSHEKSVIRPVLSTFIGGTNNIIHEFAKDSSMYRRVSFIEVQDIKLYEGYKGYEGEPLAEIIDLEKLYKGIEDEIDPNFYAIHKKIAEGWKYQDTFTQFMNSTFTENTEIKDKDCLTLDDIERKAEIYYSSRNWNFTYSTKMLEGVIREWLVNKDNCRYSKKNRKSVYALQYIEDEAHQSPDMKGHEDFLKEISNEAN